MTEYLPTGICADETVCRLEILPPDWFFYLFYHYQWLYINSSFKKLSFYAKYKHKYIDILHIKSSSIRNHENMKFKYKNIVALGIRSRLNIVSNETALQLGITTPFIDILHNAIVLL